MKKSSSFFILAFLSILGFIFESLASCAPSSGSVKVSPYNEASVYAKVVLLRERGDYSGALKLMKKLVKSNPSPNYRVEYAWLRMKTGEAPKSVLRDLKNITVDDLDIVHLKQLAEIYIQSGDISSAEDVLWKIYKTTGDSASAELLAHIEIKKLNIPYVIDFARQLILTGDPFYFLPSFEVYSPAFTKEKLEKVVELYFASGKEDSAYAFILEALGRYKEAMNIYGEKFPLDRDRVSLYLSENLTEDNLSQDSPFRNLIEYSACGEWGYFLSSLAVLYYNMAPYPTFHALLSRLSAGFNPGPIPFDVQEKLWQAHLNWLYGNVDSAIGDLSQDDPREGVVRFAFLYNLYRRFRQENETEREKYREELLKQGEILLKKDLSFIGKEELSSRVVVGAILAEVEGSNSTAEKWLDIARSRGLKAPYPFAKLGDVLYDLRNYRKAIEAYDGYINYARDDKSRASGYFSKALSLYLLGEKEKSVEALKKSIELDPENPTALNFLGYHLIDTAADEETVREGLGYVEKALKKYPDDYAFLDSAGWGYYRLYELTGRQECLDKALGYFEKAWEEMKKYQEEDAVVLYHFGVVLIEKHQLTKARELLEKARALVKEGKVSEFDDPEEIARGIEKALAELASQVHRD